MGHGDCDILMETGGRKEEGGMGGGTVKGLTGRGDIIWTVRKD